jgi:hypothetical protein
MRRKKKRGAPIERFLAKVNRNGPRRPHMKTRCHEWMASLFRTGYGKFNSGDGRIVRAHRWLYMEANGSLPIGTDVMHECDNRKCVNILHLRAGTRGRNMKDAVRRERVPRGDLSPHSKVFSGQIKEMLRKRSCGYLLRELAAEYAISIASVSRVCRGLQRRVG